jgi:glycerol-3-phosphate cytidylyltransferase
MKVLTVGTFDLLHSGHINLIKSCYKLAGSHGEVIIGVNSDEFVLRYKKVSPVIPLKDRLEVISNLLKVDKVVINNSNSLEKLLLEEKPDILVVGSDWAKKDYYNQIGVTQEWLIKNDILLVYVEYTKDISSTLLRSRLNDKTNEK